MNELIQQSRYPSIHFENDDYLFNKTYTDETGRRHLDYISVNDLYGWHEHLKEKDDSQKLQRS